MIASARRVSLRVLRDVATGRRDLADAQTRARTTLPDPRDRSLSAEIVLGTLRWRAKLDAIIEQLSSRPLARLDTDILDLLRMSIYQLLHLHRVPAHAVVDDAVRLARDLGKRSAAPYVNAVLRAVNKEPAAFCVPTRPSGAARDSPVSEADHSACLDYLSIALSHPRWLVKRWLHRVGFDATERWTTFNNQAAPIALRVNPLLTTATQLANELRQHDVHVTAGRYSPLTLIVTRGNPLTTPLGRDDLFWAQDEASQLVGELVTVSRDDSVLDLCAAPGGKSLVISTARTDGGLFIAGERSARRIRALADTLAAMHARSPRIVRLDARHPPCGSVFDWVVLDTPCTGLGTLRRNPDIRWRRSLTDVHRMATAQQELIRGAATAVCPGGRLLYATCSSEPEENREVVEQFLQQAPDFTLEHPTVPQLASLVDVDGYFETSPARDNLEGFFAATLRRTIA